MLGLYSLEVDFGRHGSLTGLFICGHRAVDYCKWVNASVWYHDFLGKHSEAKVEINDKNVTLLTDEPAAIDALSKVGWTISDSNIIERWFERTLEDMYDVDDDVYERFECRFKLLMYEGRK